MKLYNWIDRFIDSFEKRVFLFIFILFLYWMWQILWIGVCFYDLFQVDDYASLFAFYPNLGKYECSLIIRVIYYVISHPVINVLDFLGCFHFVDIFGIVGLLVFAGKYKVEISIGLVWIVTVFVLIWLGLGSSSLNMVIYWLHCLSISGLIVCGILLIFGLIRIVNRVKLFTNHEH